MFSELRKAIAPQQGEIEELRGDRHPLETTLTGIHLTID
jgi:hypothetical protein